MRLGMACQPRTSAANYRAVFPLQELERRGHEVVWPADDEAALSAKLHASCDVVHVYRRCDDRTRRLAGELSRCGVAVTWDNDDDFTCPPREHPHYAQVGGVHARRIFADSVAMATQANRMSTTTERLRCLYSAAGIESVHVIPNALQRGRLSRPRRHEGVVIGWVAGLEHQADAARIGIGDALDWVCARHPDVRVECIGVDLKLARQYRHTPEVHFLDLAARIDGFDMGIAPLADIPFNEARSDIKVLEYAASGVPWLASPIGPYARLGREHGGWLVEDDAWADALDRLVREPRTRRRLARRARRWAKRSTIASVADRWEALFTEAAANATGACDPNGDGREATPAPRRDR